MERDKVVERVGMGVGGRGRCDVVYIANHSRSISITEYSLCTPKVILLSRNHTDFNITD